jgi:hypothetical protein
VRNEDMGEIIFRWEMKPALKNLSIQETAKVVLWNMLIPHPFQVIWF